MNKLKFSHYFAYLVACLLSLPPIKAATVGNLQYWSNPNVQDGPGGTQLALGAQNGPVDLRKYYVPPPTIGQVITAPSLDSILTSFTVATEALPSGFEMNFSAAVYAWDAATFRPTGDALTTLRMSSPILNGPTQYLNGLTALTFSPDVQLSPGQRYVVVFTTLGLAQHFPYSGTSFGVTPTDTYSGGEMVFASIGTLVEQSTPGASIESEMWGDSKDCDQSNLSSLCTMNSSYFSGFGDYVAPDMAFSATFTPATPEPRDTLLMSIGLVVLGTASQMRKMGQRKHRRAD